MKVNKPIKYLVYSVLLLLVGIAYVVFIDGNGFTLMDKEINVVQSSAGMQLRDLVILIPLLCCIISISYLGLLKLKEKQQVDTKYTRTISSKLALAGLLGFTGCLPLIIPFPPSTLPFPYLFFGFFGFFGFYYEGKMSHTLIDERYEMNLLKARATASEVALRFIIMLTIFSITIFKIEDMYTMISLLFVFIGLAFALSIFLNQYLLYKYDCEE